MLTAHIDPNLPDPAIVTDAKSKQGSKLAKAFIQAIAQIVIGAGTIKAWLLDLLRYDYPEIVSQEAPRRFSRF